MSRDLLESHFVKRRLSKTFKRAEKVHCNVGKMNEKPRVVRLSSGKNSSSYVLSELFITTGHLLAKKYLPQLVHFGNETVKQAELLKMCA